MAAQSDYKNFGSFFTEDVEEMMQLSESQWEGLPPPFSVEGSQPKAIETFGEACRDQFLINFEDFTFVNHGAFGSPLRHVVRDVRSWQDYCESQPLRFLDRELFVHMVTLLRDMAAFLVCRPDELAFVPNATTGLSTVLANTHLEANDEVLMMDIGYGSVKVMAQAACDSVGARLVQAHIKLPVQGDAAVVDALLACLSERTRLVILDAVTSNTGLALPVATLAVACKQRLPGVKLLVDGAHALGQLDVRLAPRQGREPSSFGPIDFFAANCHKWLCGPRGTAVLWVPKASQHGFQPLVKSHGLTRGFTSAFIWDGCRDYCSYLGVQTALRWWRRNGPDRVRSAMRRALRGGVAVLTQTWHGDEGVGLLAPLDMHVSMACVQLPLVLQPPTASSAHAKAFQDTLYANRIEVPVKCLRGSLYVRISAHVYNQVSDYENLSSVVLKVAAGDGAVICSGSDQRSK